ncbi:hemerythrin domain-containing protein [Rhodobacterales bacterium HKCCE3408]|nr:hemerythrin domain-containing protein [Rhodobacterales bacterium HKCCE3408]
MTDFSLDHRDGLPDALRILLKDYPREAWDADPNFSGLVQFWLDRHLMFRRLLELLREETEGVLDGGRDPERYRVALSRYGGHLVADLHGHHQIEDHHYFPILAQKDARIGAGFELLDADHHALDGHLNDFVETANAALQAEEAKRRDAIAAFAAGRDRLERLIDRHLTDEEELVVPVILKYGASGLG